jgi:hypothetical protein
MKNFRQANQKTPQLANAESVESFVLSAGVS